MTTDEAIQKRFSFKHRNRNLPWYPRRGTRDELAELFGTLNFNEGAEIGTNHGRYAVSLCSKNPNLHLSCIDPWSSYYEIAMVPQDRQEMIYKEAVQTLASYNVSIMRMPSMDGVKLFPDEALDFVYIDGDHAFDYVMMDLIHWVPKVKFGGIVALHDYHPFVGQDVMMAIDAYTHCHGVDPWYLTRDELPTAYWVRKHEVR